MQILILSFSLRGDSSMSHAFIGCCSRVLSLTILRCLISLQVTFCPRLALSGWVSYDVSMSEPSKTALFRSGNRMLLVRSSFQETQWNFLLLTDQKNRNLLREHMQNHLQGSGKQNSGLIMRFFFSVYRFW